MLTLIYSLVAPFTSMVLLISASGLCNTFVSIRLEMEGYSNEVIGGATSALYAGIFIGSIWIDRWIAKMGLAKSFIVFALASTMLVLGQTLWIDAYYWMVLRFVGGICTAGVFIVLESWLLIQGPPAMRGSILSIYLAIFYASLTIGQLLIHFCDPGTLYPFYVTAFLSMAAVFPLCMKSTAEPKIEKNIPLKVFDLFKISPMGLSGILISGIIIAALYGLLPVYGKEVGFTAPQVGNLMALLITGGLLFQWPLGKLADLGDRKVVLMTIGIVAAVVSGVIGVMGTVSPVLFFGLIFLFGGFTLTIYPLSMAFACEKVNDEQLVSATGGFVLSYGFGAIVGPLMAPIAMSYIGINGLFYFLACMASIFVLTGCRKN